MRLGAYWLSNAIVLVQNKKVFISATKNPKQVLGLLQLAVQTPKGSNICAWNVHLLEPCIICIFSAVQAHFRNHFKNAIG